MGGGRKDDHLFFWGMQANDRDKFNFCDLFLEIQINDKRHYYKFTYSNLSPLNPSTGAGGRLVARFIHPT